MIDLTLTVGSILAVSAVVAPVLTSIINNRYQLKMKQLELEDNRKQREIQRIIDIYDTYAIASGGEYLVSNGRPYFCI